MTRIFRLMAVAALLSSFAVHDAQSDAPSAAQAGPGRRIYASVTVDQLRHAVLATFLDLGYMVDGVGPGGGKIMASKGKVLRVTASMEPVAGGVVLRFDATIRNGGFGSSEIDSPAFFNQNLFTPLDTAIALARDQP